MGGTHRTPHRKDSPLPIDSETNKAFKGSFGVYSLKKHDVFFNLEAQYDQKKAKTGKWGRAQATVNLETQTQLTETKFQSLLLNRHDEFS